MIEDDPRPNREEAVAAICAIGLDPAKPGSERTVVKLEHGGDLRRHYPDLCWRHQPDEPRCNCEFPKIWTVYPHECQNCMRLLP